MLQQPDSYNGFYDRPAEYYHLLFEDWDRSIQRQAEVLNPLIVKETGRSCVNLLDCACGIGTQAIGFAQAGHHVVASDSSRPAVDRAEREARHRDLDISFFVSDMTSLDVFQEAASMLWQHWTTPCRI
jgi:glycine/sarcosine N-methyltransferase